MTTLLETPQNLESAQIQDGLTFAAYDLPPFLREGLKRANFVSPTAIQAESIPVLMAGLDLVAQSQTGSGKTAAFAIPLLARVQRQSRDLQALVMVPTRELAIQVTQVFKILAGPGVRVTPVYGGTGMMGQIKALSQGGYQVVIGTPGRLRDHLNRGTLKLNRLRMVVLDEADEMLDRGFAPDIEAILSVTPPVAQRQTALFSATLPEWVAGTASKHLRPDHAKVTLLADPQHRPDIEQLVFDMNIDDKAVALRHLLDIHNSQPVLVFARTKHGVKKLSDKLQNEGYSAAGLQGNLSQRAREDVMAAFRTGRVQVMVATNVGARGLDVSGISHVINYDLPESAELFTHRVGRTGRNGASGTAITFLTRQDRPKWREIERALLDNKVDFTHRAWDGPRATAETKAQAQADFRREREEGFEGDAPRRSFGNSWDNNAPPRPERRPEFGTRDRDNRFQSAQSGPARPPRREDGWQTERPAADRSTERSGNFRPRREGGWQTERPAERSGNFRPANEWQGEGSVGRSSEGRSEERPARSGNRPFNGNAPRRRSEDSGFKPRRPNPARSFER